MERKNKKLVNVLLVLCVGVFILYNINLASLNLETIYFIGSIIMTALALATMLVFISSRKKAGLERIKPICIALLAIWWVFPGLFMFYEPAWRNPEMLFWYSSWSFFSVVMILSIIYLAGTRNKGTKKYPIVMCMLAAIFSLAFWNVTIV